MEGYWVETAFMFEKAGFDIYKGLEVEYLQQNGDEELGVQIERRLQVGDFFSIEKINTKS